MLPKSHMCRIFSKEVSLCRPSQRILSYISWPSLVSSRFVIVPVSVWWSFLHLVRGQRPRLDFDIFSHFCHFPGLRLLYHLLHWHWYWRVSHTILICGMDPLCIVRGHDLLYFYHGSALYIFGGHFRTEHGYARLRIFVGIWPFDFCDKCSVSFCWTP